MQNVLVCDDDEAILESLRIYLDNAGFNVITAVDGQDALEKVQNNEIHCVVLDIMMPRLDGLKATLKIRENIIFLLFFFRQRVRIRTKLQVLASAQTIM